MTVIIHLTKDEILRMAEAVKKDQTENEREPDHLYILQGTDDVPILYLNPLFMELNGEKMNQNAINALTCALTKMLNRKETIQLFEIAEEYLDPGDNLAGAQAELSELLGAVLHSRDSQQLDVEE